jgi:DNA invertase Pin-like site-specific DNA recombinase
MLIGYARVSTTDQETATQVAALKAAGCERVFEKYYAGASRLSMMRRVAISIMVSDVCTAYS